MAESRYRRLCADWHVPEQYTLHRTQAADYFPPDDFEALTSALTAFGQQELGCRSISPPWLSFYTDGCEQRLHADVPQGPFAYVLSLTRWDERRFTGGETCIMQPQITDYWRDFDSSRGLEYSDLMCTVAPEFNRLTVFDARLPHGVGRVHGEMDPRGSRLVLHGWFTEPEPFFEGGLDEAAVESGLQAVLRKTYDAIGAPSVTGLLSVRMDVNTTGRIDGVERLADVLVADPAQLPPGVQPTEARERVVGTIMRELGEASFEPCKEPSRIILPFIFD